MLHNIEVKFKSLNSLDILEINDLTKINVFVGKPNMGKTHALNYISDNYLSYGKCLFIEDKKRFSKQELLETFYGGQNPDEVTLVCIDEIENGMHFSVMKDVCNSLISISKDISDSQFFITTHSLEFIDSLNDVALENKFGDSVTVYNIANMPDGKRARRYTMADIKHLLLSKTEFRN